MLETLHQSREIQLSSAIREENNAAVDIANRAGVRNIKGLPVHRTERRQYDALHDVRRDATDVHEREVHDKAVIRRHAGVTFHDANCTTNRLYDGCVGIQKHLPRSDAISEGESRPISSRTRGG
jgi:hypothetical protein